MTAPEPPWEPLSPAEERHRDVSLRLLPVAASLAGVCMAGLVLLQAAAPDTSTLFYADEVLALDALLLVVCVYLILLGARTSSRARSRRLFVLVDIVFITALTTMLLASLYIVYWVL